MERVSTPSPRAPSEDNSHDSGNSEWNNKHPRSERETTNAIANTWCLLWLLAVKIETVEKEKEETNQIEEALKDIFNEKFCCVGSEERSSGGTPPMSSVVTKVEEDLVNVVEEEGHHWKERLVVRRE